MNPLGGPHARAVTSRACAIDHRRYDPPP